MRKDWATCRSNYRGPGGSGRRNQIQVPADRAVARAVINGQGDFQAPIERRFPKLPNGANTGGHHDRWSRQTARVRQGGADARRTPKGPETGTLGCAVGAGMIKNEALDLMQALRQTAVFGLVLRESCDPSLTATAIRGTAFGFVNGGTAKIALHLNVLADTLEDASLRPILMNNLGLVLKRLLVRDSYEIVNTYAEGTGQREQFRQWGPYNFVRVLRNTLSHTDGGTLHKWPPKLTSAHWRDRTLLPGDLGKALTLQPGEYVELQDDLYRFLHDELR